MQVVLADPPWHYVKKGRVSGGPISPAYETLSLDKLKLMAPAVAEDAFLFLWATSPKMDEAIELMKAWGFRYRTVFIVWSKRYKSGEIASAPGIYCLPSCEFLLLGVRGSIQGLLGRPRLQLLESTRREHSRKPDEAYELIESFVGPEVKKLEMFARQRRAGWEAHGNQVDHYNS